MLIQSMTTYTKEQKEWMSKLMRTLMPNISYPPNYTTYLDYYRSLRYKSGVKYVLEDDGKILFNLPATSEFPNAIKLPTILYSRTKIWEEQIWRDLNRHYVINPEHRRYVKAFVSLMRRYRKEYRKHYLLKYIKPQARREATRCILFDKTQLPKEVLNEIVSYM